MPYIGEIRMTAFNWYPEGWYWCNGALLPIAEYETLFILIGTTYGGDGQETFALPDLRGRVPMHMGSLNNVPFQIGSTGGTESETLTALSTPAHSHPLLASQSPGGANTPVGNVLAAGPAIDLYLQDAASSVMKSNAVGAAGGSQPHENMQPYLAINFIISLYGEFPQFS